MFRAIRNWFYRNIFKIPLTADGLTLKEICREVNEGCTNIEFAKYVMGDLVWKPYATTESWESTCKFVGELHLNHTLLGTIKGEHSLDKYRIKPERELRLHSSQDQMHYGVLELIFKSFDSVLNTKLLPLVEFYNDPKEPVGVMAASVRSKGHEVTVVLNRNGCVNLVIYKNDRGVVELSHQYSSASELLAAIASYKDYLLLIHDLIYGDNKALINVLGKNTTGIKDLIDNDKAGIGALPKETALDIRHEAIRRIWASIQNRYVNFKFTTVTTDKEPNITVTSITGKNGYVLSIAVQTLSDETQKTVPLIHLSIADMSVKDDNDLRFSFTKSYVSYREMLAHHDDYSLPIAQLISSGEKTPTEFRKDIIHLWCIAMRKALWYSFKLENITEYKGYSSLGFRSNDMSFFFMVQDSGIKITVVTQAEASSTKETTVFAKIYDSVEQAIEQKAEYVSYIKTICEANHELLHNPHVRELAKTMATHLKDMKNSIDSTAEAIKFQNQVAETKHFFRCIQELLNNTYLPNFGCCIDVKTKQPYGSISNGLMRFSTLVKHSCMPNEPHVEGIDNLAILVRDKDGIKFSREYPSFAHAVLDFASYEPWLIAICGKNTKLPLCPTVLNCVKPGTTVNLSGRFGDLKHSFRFPAIIWDTVTTHKEPDMSKIQVIIIVPGMNLVDSIKSHIVEQMQANHKGCTIYTADQAVIESEHAELRFLMDHGLESLLLAYKPRLLYMMRALTDTEIGSLEEGSYTHILYRVLDMDVLTKHLTGLLIQGTIA